MRARGLLLALAAVAGCASAAEGTARRDFDRAAQVADEIERRGAYDAARRQALALEPWARPEERGALRLRACALWEQEGQNEAARACYTERLADVDAEAAANAALRLAQIEDDTGAAEAARALQQQIIDRWPDTDAAPRALRLRLRQEDARGGAAARLTWLDRQVDLQPMDVESGRRLRANACVTAATIATAELSQHGRAVDLLARCEPAWRDTVWADDALILWARSLAALGELRPALAVYARLIEARSPSWLVGSYDSIYFDDAWFERAQILEKLGDYDAALAAYDDLGDEAPTSRWLDDARFCAARLRLAVLGDAAPLARFVVEFPESRHVRAAAALLAASPEGS